MTLIHIKAPDFTASLVANGNIILKAEPIVKYMVGWQPARVFSYAQNKGWECTSEQQPS